MAKRQRNDGIRKVCACGRRRWSTCAHAWHLNFKWDAAHYRLERFSLVLSTQPWYS